MFGIRVFSIVRPRIAAVGVIGVIVSLTVGSVAVAQSNGDGSSDTGGSTTQSGLPFAQFISSKLPGGDFIQASHNTRTVNNAGIPGQACPFNLFMPALPPGAVPEFTYVTWSYLSDDLSVPGALEAVHINGIPFGGNTVATGTPDLCWGKEGAVAYLCTTDVTFSINFGGLNTIDNVCDKALGTDANALGEGISIVTLYSIPGKSTRQVTLYFGYISDQSNPAGRFAEATLDLKNKYAGGNLHFFINAIDGQERFDPDAFFINGVNVSTITGVAGNAWRGLLGPSGAPAFDNLYDAFDGDVGTSGLDIKAAGATSLDILTTTSNDCIGHSFAAVSLPVTAACCNFNGECTEETVQECEAQQGHVAFPGFTCADIDCGAVPTVSEWALIVMTLLACTIGTLVYRARRTAAA